MNAHDGGFLNVPRAVITLALLTSGAVTPAIGEPISAIYGVQIFERISTAGGIFSREPFDEQFTLRLTIDPALASPMSAFGPAMFSPIPLATILPPDEVLPFLNGGGFTSLFPGNDVLGADAREIVIGSTPGPAPYSHYLRSVRLFGLTDESNVGPAVDAVQFLMLLGAGPPGELSFEYRSILCTGFAPGLQNCDEDFPQSPQVRFSFSGTATLLQIESPVNPEPIPEPATLALVGSGLGLLVQRYRLMRRSGCHTRRN